MTRPLWHTRDDLWPCRCRTCGRASEPRPLGRTPHGWGRDEGGQGFYYCAACRVREEAAADV